MAEHERSSADPPENLLEFETLISELSSRFINVPPSEVDHEIEDAQRRVCELLGIDQSVLWQRSSVFPHAFDATHIYYVDGDLRSAGPLSDELFPWVRKQMLAGRMVAIPSLEELPAEAAVDRESARRLGIKSDLCLPLSVGGEPVVGALAFNTLRAERDWPDALVKRLQLVAQVFANALARRRKDQSLRESEERLALAADSAGAGLWIFDYGTGVFWVTERARAIFGYLPEEVVSVERLQASVHPDDWEIVRSAIERSDPSEEPFRVEYRIILPGDGGVRWISSRARRYLKSTGEPERLMGASLDVTERKRAEEALRASEARLEAGVDLAGLAFIESDEGTGTVFTDDRLRELVGFPPDREPGMQIVAFWMEHVHPDDAPRVLAERRQALDGKREELRVEYRYLHPARGEIWIQHIGRPTRRDATGFAVNSFSVLRDITQRKRAEEERRELSRSLIRAHEEERALLARELHDDVTQRLAVLAIEAGRAELAAPDGAQADAMRSVREGLVRLSEDIHSLAYQLHPSVLEELGLAEALRAECERVCSQGRVDLSVEFHSLPEFFARDAALCLFRVAQEALNNVIRHAGARAASVTLRQMDGGLLLAVRDDGVGFDPVNPRMRRSLGLASMRERVLLVNGTLDIESAAGHGTAIIAWVPAEGEVR